MGHIYIVIYINIWVNFTTTEPCSPEPALVHHGLCEGDHPHWWPQDSGGLEHEFYDFPFSWEYETTNQYIHIYIYSISMCPVIKGICFYVLVDIAMEDGLIFGG